MPDDLTPSTEQITAIRGFNRFYTRQMGLLDERLLTSAFTLAQSRVLYELAHRDGLTATDLGRDLGLDAGYLSRLLSKLEAAKLITRKASPTDGRQVILALTKSGRRAFAPLNQAAHDQIAGLLDRIAPRDRVQLVGAMTTIQRVLDGRAEPTAPYTLRPHAIGDMGWVARRQGMLYADEYGWDATFEALVAEIAAGFIKAYDPARERCWIAERDGEIVGSVFVVKGSEQVAKLRLLYVEPSARGLGIGKHLVEDCIGFARAKGYTTLTLWTNDILVSARRIYVAAGFKLMAEEKHRSFGKDLVGQNWDLAL